MMRFQIFYVTPFTMEHKKKIDFEYGTKNEQTKENIYEKRHKGVNTDYRQYQSNQNGQ